MARCSHYGSPDDSPARSGRCVLPALPGLARCAEHAGRFDVLPLAPAPWQKDRPEWANGCRWWVVPESWGDRPFPGDGFATRSEAVSHAKAHGIRLAEHPAVFAREDGAS